MAVNPSSEVHNVPVSSLDALRVLQAELDAREQRVYEREQRVWEWRLVALARDAEMESEARHLKEQEVALQRKEANLVSREIALADREAQLSAKMVLLQEEHNKAIQAARIEISKLKSQILGSM